MTLFIFGFDKVAFNEGEFFDSRANYLKAADFGDVHTIDTELHAKRKPIGPGTDYEWGRRLFMFNSDQEIQSLVVRLYTKDVVGEMP